MAHPQLHRQGDRRAFLAAGTAVALLLAPAAHALPVGDSLDCSPEAVEGDSALRQLCVEAGVLPALVETAPETVQEAAPKTVQEAVQPPGDPIEEVVGEVLDKAPAPAGDAVPEAPAVVEDAVDSVPPPPAPVDPALLPGPVTEPAGDEVDAADGSVAPVRPAAPQGPGIAVPPFIRRGIPVSTSSRTTPTLRHQPIAPPVMSAPFFGDLARVAEEFVSSRSPVSTSLEAFTGGGTSTVPGPDASSWLLATASGMLLLVGASHLVHARHRYTASVAR